MNPVFSLRHRFFETEDPDHPRHPLMRAAHHVCLFFFALFLRLQFLLASLVVTLITVLFVDSVKLKAIQTLHTQDLCDSLKKD